MIGAVLALKAMRRNALPHVVAGVAIISVLTPLMLLYGIKTGVVDGLVADLKRDPRVLALTVSGHISLTGEQINRIRSMPETRFLVGATRSSAARMEFESDANTSAGLFPADVVPTAAGDPLLQVIGLAALPEPGIVLSQALADKLHVAKGSKITGRNMRNGTEEIALPFKVEGILSEGYLAGDRALAPEAVLARLEAFLDGYAVPTMGIAGRDPASRRPTLESLRVYAKSIGDVVTLDRELEKLGFRVRSNASQITLVENLDRVMTGLIAIIAAVGVAGFVVSFWASLASVFQLYRRQASLLKLLGLNRFALASFPVTQAAVTTTLALVASCLLFALVAVMINRFFSIGYVPGNVCILRPIHFLIVVGVTYAVALLISLRLSRALLALSPVEAVREA